VKQMKQAVDEYSRRGATEKDQWESFAAHLGTCRWPTKMRQLCNAVE